VDKITLDRDVFKALASDTRLDILKRLDVRQKTVTELAKEMDLNKATVFEHLEKLAAVNLIQKVAEDAERKWVYWQLTWTGRRLLHPETITLAILLSTALGSVLTAAAAYVLWLRANLPTTQAPEAGGMSIRAAPIEEVPIEPSSADPLLVVIAICLGLLTLALVSAAVWVHLRAQKRGDTSAPLA
jgi:DNA-binding transcriptional ArsR family regulator